MLFLKGVILVLSCCVALSTQEKLSVSVYYEALCPDSVQFITKQFYPVYTRFKSYLDVDLVPYGKAIQNNVDGKWEFQCQHGPKECYGNKIQGCVLHSNANFDTKMSFVNCIMRSSSPSSDQKAQECAQNNNISWDPIKNCANGATGDDYLAAYGDQTHGHDINISFVPTVMYNNQYDDKLQWESLRNFKNVVCKKLGNPTECDS